MRGTHEAKDTLEKFKECFNPVSRLSTRELELAGHLAHVFANTSKHLAPTAPQLVGVGFREIAPIVHDDARRHSARERFQQFAVSDRGRGQVKGTESPFFVALDWTLKPYHQPRPVLGPARAVLTRGGHLANG